MPDRRHAGPARARQPRGAVRLRPDGRRRQPARRHRRDAQSVLSDLRRRGAARRRGTYLRELASRSAASRPTGRRCPTTVWARTQLLYVCSPDNPTGRVIDAGRVARAVRALRPPRLRHRLRRVLFRDLFRRGAARRCRRARRRACRGARRLPQPLVFGSLSKRSNAPGLRSGYVAGDAALLKAFLLYRTYHGSAMSPAVAHGEPRRVERRGPRARQPPPLRRQVRGPAAEVAQVLPCAMPDAAFYLWAAHPDRRRRVRAAGCYAEQNVTVLPGSLLARDTPRRQSRPRPHPHRAGGRRGGVRGGRRAHRRLRPRAL